MTQCDHLLGYDWEPGEVCVYMTSYRLKVPESFVDKNLAGQEKGCERFNFCPRCGISIDNWEPEG